jgi:hypothetical protein
MGTDPSAQRKAERAARSDTFELLAREWLEVQKAALNQKTFLNKPRALRGVCLSLHRETPDRTAQSGRHTSAAQKHRGTGTTRDRTSCPLRMRERVSVRRGGGPGRT